MFDSRLWFYAVSNSCQPKGFLQCKQYFVIFVETSTSFSLKQSQQRHKKHKENSFKAKMDSDEGELVIDEDLLVETHPPRSSSEDEQMYSAESGQDEISDSNIAHQQVTTKDDNLDIVKSSEKDKSRDEEKSRDKEKSDKNKSRDKEKSKSERSPSSKSSKSSSHKPSSSHTHSSSRRESTNSSSKHSSTNKSSSYKHSSDKSKDRRSHRSKHDKQSPKKKLSNRPYNALKLSHLPDFKTKMLNVSLPSMACG